MFSTNYDKRRADLHHRHHPFQTLHQSFANYGTETMQKIDLRDFSDDLLHNLHGIPDPLRKNLADTIITSENLTKTKKKLEEPLTMPEEQPTEVPTVQTSALSGILSFISGVFHSVSGAMFRPRSPVYHDCFTDGDWHFSNTEQDKIGTESPVDSSEMNTDSRTAVAACEGKLNQVRYLLSSPRPIGSVWVRKRPKKAFVEPGSVEDSFEDAFSPEDFINLPNDSFIKYYSPYSYQNEELFETGALKTKVERPVTKTTANMTVVDKEKQEKDSSNQEKQLLQPEEESIKSETESMKSEKEILNLENNHMKTEQVNQEKLNTEISAKIEKKTVQQKETLNSENQTTKSTNELPATKDEVDYIATDKHQLISTCEDKLSKLKALLCKTRKSHNQTTEAESTKPITNSKTTDKHYKNPHRTLDKRKKSKIKKSIQDDIQFANEIDPDNCIDDSISPTINSFTPTCLGDYFDEITGRFRTFSNNSEDSFQIVFNDTPRVRLSSDCESEDSFIVFEDSPDSCYTSNDVFGDSDSETESEVNDSGCSTLTCKLSHSLSRTVSNLTDDSLYAESGDEIDYSNIEKVLKCDEINMKHDEFRDRSEVKLESDDLKAKSDDLNNFNNEIKNGNEELKLGSVELKLRSDELNCEVGKKTGLLLDDDRKKKRRGQPVKKVQFSSQPPKVHLMRVWSFAARQARAGHWERYAVDRERFKRRIADVDMAVSWVLKPQHRARIKFQRFMPWWNQQRRAELAEKKRREEEDRVRQEEMAKMREKLVMQEYDDVRMLEEEEERVRLEELGIGGKEEVMIGQKEGKKIITQQQGLLRQSGDNVIAQNIEHEVGQKEELIISQNELTIGQKEEIDLNSQQQSLLRQSDHEIAHKKEHMSSEKEELMIGHKEDHRNSKKEEIDVTQKQGLLRQPDLEIAQKEEREIVQEEPMISQKEDHRNSKIEDVTKEEMRIQQDFKEEIDVITQQQGLRQSDNEIAENVELEIGQKDDEHLIRQTEDHRESKKDEVHEMKEKEKLKIDLNEENHQI